MALPNGYKKLRYIQSSGTQYIDTGYRPNNNTRVVMDCNVLSSGGSVQAVFGGRTSADTTSGAMFAVFFTGASTLRSDYNGAYTQAFSVPMDTRIVIDKNKETTSVNGASQSYANASFQSAGTLALFALNENGSIEAGTIASMILYACQVYDNGSLVRDFVPALRTSDNVAGLYDLINGVFYANAGSGSFAYVLAAGVVKEGIGASLIDETSYGINAGKTIVNGTAYNIKKGKTLVGGTGYDISFASGILASDIAVGSSVFLNINGTPTEFLVVNRGIPNDSLIYDSSCDGLWLLMKDVYMPSQWHSSRRNEYAASIAHSFLNGNFLNNFDTAANEAIKTVKIPYWNGTGTAGADKIGANGLTAKVFLLSMREIGLGSMSSVACPNSRVLLDYFINGDSTEAKAKRIAYSYGKASEWWTRDPKTDTTDIVWRVGTDGSNGSYYSYLSYGLRPAMILSYDAIFDEETLICKGLA